VLINGEQVKFRSTSIKACETKRLLQANIPNEKQFFCSTLLTANACVLYLKMKRCLDVLASAELINRACYIKDPPIVFALKD